MWKQFNFKKFICYRNSLYISTCMIHAYKRLIKLLIQTQPCIFIGHEFVTNTSVQLWRCRDLTLNFSFFISRWYLTLSVLVNCTLVVLCNRTSILYIELFGISLTMIFCMNLIEANFVLILRAFTFLWGKF
jgi:hypothetical protein